MKVYPVIPVFFECENGTYIDLGKVEALEILDYSDKYEKGFKLMAYMSAGRELPVRRFKTEILAKKYIRAIFSMYRKI